MYGFSVSKEGIITDNFYKQLGFYEEPNPQGAYVIIRKTENEIIINQDFCGCYGLYYFENIKENYFALSNSFLLLEEYLVGRQNFSINKDFTDNFLISGLCSPSIKETLINEIKEIPSNAIIKINIRRKQIKFLYKDYQENTIPYDSKQGLKIIDNWVDKWGYIFRSLKNKTDNLSFQLSGGFDTRTLFSILISSGIDLNKINIQSNNNSITPFLEDFKIASSISSKYKFKLNKLSLDERSTRWSLNDTLFCSIYPKLGFHKSFYWKDRFYNFPRFIFTGFGGENIRGYPGYPIEQYIKYFSSQGKKIVGFGNLFYNSSMKFFKRNIDLLKKRKKYKNNYEISSDLYFNGRTRNHFGKVIVEGFIANIYYINPIMDPEIKKIKFNINGKWSHDLIAYIYTRFAHDLIYFPFEGKRVINYKSIQKAEKLNKKTKNYKTKSNLNINFFIDFKRQSPAAQFINHNNIENHLKKLFKTTKFIRNVNKLYNNSIYNWAEEYSKNTSFFPLRQFYGLLAIEKAVEYLTLNEKYMIKN